MIRRNTTVTILTAFLLFSPHLQAKKRRTHEIKKGDTPAMLVKKYGVSYEEILRYNQMTGDAVLKVGSTLQIPDKGEVSGSTYTVKAGDSIARIADFHGVAQSDLRAANGLKAAEDVRPGQELQIPLTLRGGAARGHVIRSGDTLSSIAKTYDVSVGALANENKLKKGEPLEPGRTLIIPEEDDAAEVYKPKKPSKLIESGKKVPGGVKHTVQPGQSLWIIARAYNTSGDKIAAANGFEKGEGVRVGQELLIPGAKRVVPVRIKGFSVQPVSIISVWNNERISLRLMNNNGRIIQKSRKTLSRLAAKKKTRHLKLLHPRLIHMLQRVSERYPGKPIELISGYRERKKGQTVISKHNQGRALDFRVQGVDRRELFEFIKSMPKVGAGYYPNSVFVHMDVRDNATFWVDYSGVGEPAQYREADLDPEAAADAE